MPPPTRFARPPRTSGASRAVSGRRANRVTENGSVLERHNIEIEYDKENTMEKRKVDKEELGDAENEKKIAHTLMLINYGTDMRYYMPWDI